MKLFNTLNSWGWLARLFHWSMAAIILYMLGLGIYMSEFVNDLFEKFAYVQIHKSWGFVAFVLAILRLIWRGLNKKNPSLPDNLKHWERIAAHITHYGLYVCIIVMPLSGWLMSTASPLQDELGIRNMVFGLFEMPDPFIPGSNDLAENFHIVHDVTGKVLIALLLLHVGAAFKHLFLLKDGIFRRMSWGR